MYIHVTQQMMCLTMIMEQIQNTSAQKDFCTNNKWEWLLALWSKQQHNVNIVNIYAAVVQVAVQVAVRLRSGCGSNVTTYC